MFRLTNCSSVIHVSAGRVLSLTGLRCEKRQRVWGVLGARKWAMGSGKCGYGNVMCSVY
jgi:hypothetical protein